MSLCKTVLAVSLGGLAWGALPPALADPAMPSAPTASTPAQAIGWDKLMPAGWNPLKLVDLGKVAAWGDNDPRAREVLRKMREVWDSAPINPEVLGRPVRLTGYVVPLDDAADGIRELLLVPFFGACIHSPPPPANQIVYIRLAAPDKRFQTMDAVTAEGLLQAASSDTDMGKSGYRMDAARLKVSRDTLF